MFRTCGVFYILLGLVQLLAPALATGQVVPAFRGGGANLWAGAEYSNFNSDFAIASRVSGAGIYVDFNRDAHWSAEGEARFLRLVPSTSGTEDNYLLGPRFMFFHRGRFQPYIKVLFGVGIITFPYGLGHGSYFMYAAGGGVEYRLARRISLRGEYEQQFWPSAPGIPGLASNGMKPGGFNVGLSYRLFRAGGSLR